MSNINQMFVEYEALSIKKNKLVYLINKFKHATDSFEHYGKCYSLSHYAKQLKHAEEHYYNFMNKIRLHSHSNTLTANNIRSSTDKLLLCLTRLNTAEEEYNSALASFYCIKGRLDLVNKQMKTLKAAIINEIINNAKIPEEPSFPENGYICTCEGDGPCDINTRTCQKSSEDLSVYNSEDPTVGEGFFTFENPESELLSPCQLN